MRQGFCVFFSTPLSCKHETCKMLYFYLYKKIPEENEEKVTFWMGLPPFL